MKVLKKLNDLLIDLINHHIEIIYFGVVIIISVLVRYKLFQFVSADMSYYLLPWMEELSQGGGFSALKNEIGSYNIPYMVILAGISMITDVAEDRIFMVKLVSAIFDYSLAFFVFAVLRLNHYEKESVLAGAAVLLNPIILLNSAYWGQCDIIYAFFVILSIYFCLKEKWGLTFVFIGIGVAFKLQAAFFLPVLLIGWVKKRFSFLYFLIIPVIDFIMCLPAMIAGRPVLNVLGIYVNQPTTWREMVKNYPGVWFLFRAPVKDFYWVAILLTMFVIGTGLYSFLAYKEYNAKNFLALSIWCIWSCVMFLPAMHERYGFAMEILLIIYVLLYREWHGICVGVYLAVLCMYSYYLLGTAPWSMICSAIINLLVYFYCTCTLFKRECGGQKKALQ